MASLEGNPLGCSVKTITGFFGFTAAELKQALADADTEIGSPKGLRMAVIRPSVQRTALRALKAKGFKVIATFASRHSGRGRLYLMGKGEGLRLNKRGG